MRRDEFSAPSPHFVPNGTARSSPALSIVVPLYDEEATIGILVSRLTRVIDALRVDAEVILVDDGSADGTLAAIARAHAADPRFVGLSLSRNFGHQLAITAGLANARGGAVVVMDGDLQDPPEAIGTLWRKLGEGYGEYSAIRAGQVKSALGSWPTRRSIACSAARDREVVDAGDFGIASRRGPPQRDARATPVSSRSPRVARLPANRDPRRPRGTARRSSQVHIRQAARALQRLPAARSFSDAPLRLAGAFGLTFLAAAISGLIAGLARVAWGGGWPAAGWYWVGLIVACTRRRCGAVGDIQGEYVGRILHEVHGRPLYVVRRRIGISSPKRAARRAESRTR